MSPSFNLIDEPWIPCVLSDGGQIDLGLRETLTRAAEISEILAETPPATVAIYRLLLSVLHRCFGPENVAAWQALWQRGGFDADAIGQYLERWRQRFDLFDDERPFYQTAAVGHDSAGSVAKLLFQADNNPTLFDHAAVDTPPELSPAQAARLVLVIQAFDTSGMKTGIGAEKSAKAGPLIQCAICVVRGENVFQTLLLNLHRYRPEDSEPFNFDREMDRPAWERDTPVRPEDRYPDGYLDLLTWQSRRVRLLPEVEADRMVVRQAVVMKGYQFPKGYDRHSRETMVAFRKNTAKGAPDPWPPIRFQEERALWRDGHAFMQSLHDAYLRPKTVDWLSVLAGRGAIPRFSRIQLDLFGLAADKAKLLFWRHERLEVPSAYLEDSVEARLLIGDVRVALQLSERAGRLLGRWSVGARVMDREVRTRSPMLVLAEALIGTKDEPSALIEHLAPERRYWPRLDGPFRELLGALPEDLTRDQWGEPELRGVALAGWAQVVEKAARDAFAESVEGLESSAKGMRAVALAERELGWRLAELMAPYREVVPGGVA